MKIVNMVTVGCFIFCMITVVGLTDAAQNDQPSLDELLQLLPAPRDRENVPIHQDNAQDIHADVLQQLFEDQPGDVFGRAVQEMDRVADRIGHDLDVGLETQRLQESVLAKLDQVIAVAKKAGLSSGSSGAGSGSSGGQAQPQDTGSALNATQKGNLTQGDSQNTGGNSSGGGSQSVTAPSHNQGALQDHRLQWGNLPARLRDDLLQGLNEQFSSVYRELTDQYYRRLAQEGQE